jgi:hypothetical protein
MGNPLFKYYEFDVNEFLPASWRDDISQLVKKYSVERILSATSVTSREVSPDITVPAFIVDGDCIKERMPWLYDLYRGFFRDMGQKCVTEPVSTAKEPVYGVNLNIQRGSKMRYECHVDSNPIQGMLYVTTHPEGTGGELVVSNRPEAVGPEDIEKDCVRIFPKSGHLVFFDARQYPHYVAPLKNDDAVRIAAAMNFYIPSAPEEMRPSDLNKHLFGK